MFIPGLLTNNESFPTWWNAYIHATLVNCVSAGRQDLLINWCTLAGGLQLYYAAPNDETLSGVAIVVDDVSAVVAFQGTRNTLQVIAQILQSPQQTYPGIAGAVNGYYGAVFFEQKALYQSAIDSLPPDFKFYFAGHSAGGALAHVAYKWFDEFENFDARGCVTFGQPRTGNPRFAQNTSPPFLRIIAQDDFVVTLPPNTFQTLQLVGPLAAVVLGANYNHARAGWLMNLDGTTVPGNSNIIDTWGPPIPNALLRLRRCWTDCYGRHLISNYVSMLFPRAQAQGSPVDLLPFKTINDTIGV
jgi:Lipase (class 3)